MDHNKGATKFVSVKTIIHSKYFILGYNDYCDKRPFNPKYDYWKMNEQFNYERGRHYASIFGNLNEYNPKIGKKVNYAAIYAASAMINQNLLI
jgi:hypothetical protein